MKQPAISNCGMISPKINWCKGKAGVEACIHLSSRGTQKTLGTQFENSWYRTTLHSTAYGKCS